MPQTYKATGINLKSMPLGESDRLLTILTREFGLIRAVAPGARKHRSKIGGRSALFVVNDLLIAKGRSLDKITQAETLESYIGLSQGLGKLASGQYLAELVLTQALSQQPQEELFYILSEHLRRLESLPDRINSSSATLVLAHLTHGIFHLLALAGVAPQVQACCATQRPLSPNFTDPDWRVGFSISDGGIISLSELAKLETERKGKGAIGLGRPLRPTGRGSVSPWSTHINATELAVLQQLASPRLPQPPTVINRSNLPTEGRQEIESESESWPSIQKARGLSPVAPPLPMANSWDQVAVSGLSVTAEISIMTYSSCWVSVERLLRQYAQYHLGQPIRSADLLDTYLETVHPV